jgi:glycosyltransferase involved in cell wall biosynthesis
VRQLAGDRRFRFLVLGGVVDHPALAAARRNAPVEALGWYRPPELADRLCADSDVVAFTSLAPESWSQTVSEALALGLPVVAFDQGAVAERLRRLDAANFLVSPTEGVDGFTRRLRALANRELCWPFDCAEPEWSPSQMAKRYVEVYEQLAASARPSMVTSDSERPPCRTSV